MKDNSSKRKLRILFLIVYLLIVGVVYLTSLTLSKYVTSNVFESDFTIGEKLYFDYTRGDLFRGDQLIIGVPIEEEIYDSNGVLVNTKRRIETMNVAPGDIIKYHFFVSNVDETVSEVNSVYGEFFVSSSAILSLPFLGNESSVACTVTYRPIYEGVEPGAFTDLAKDKKLDLPKYDGTDGSIVKYEFQIYVVLDDQIKATSDDDYVGATLTIYLFVDAANKVGA